MAPFFSVPHNGLSAAFTDKFSVMCYDQNAKALPIFFYAKKEALHLCAAGRPKGRKENC